MKKRILAMLLAGALTVSGLPITAIAADDTTAAVTADPLADAAWSDNVAEVDDILGDGDSYQYLHVYDLDYAEDGAIYEDKNAIMEAGKDYRLSFWYRCAPTANWPVTDSKTGEGIRELRLFGSGNKNLISTYPSEGNIINGSRLVATSEWQKATVLITPTADQYAWFRFRDGNYFEDIIPFDIYGLSLVEVDKFGYTGEEMIKYNDKIISSTNGWYINSAKGKIVTEATYLRVTADAADSTTATLSGLKLDSGRYTVSADIRMTKYDFNNYTAGASHRYNNNNAGNVTFGGTSGVSVIGTAAAIDNNWSVVSFELDVPTAVTAGELTFTLNNALGLDINNVTITKTASYGDFADANGNQLLTVAEKLDENGTNEYVRFYDTDSPDDELKYKSDITLDTAKTYVLTMDMRAAEHVNWGKYHYGASGTRATAVDSYERNVIIDVAGVIGKSADEKILTNSWKNIKIEFTPTETSFWITIREGSGWYGFYDMIPYDIDNLQLTEKSSGDVIIEAGTAEAVGDGTGIGWYTTNAKAEVATDTEFYRLKNSTSFNYTGDEKIEKGIYRVTLDVRLNLFDGDDFTWANEKTAKTPTNNCNVSVSLNVNGETMKTAAGTLAAIVTNGTKTLNNSWQTIEFTLPVTETINKSDLIFTLDKITNFDFKNLTVESAAHLYSDEYVTLDGEFIDRISSNGNEYISVSNLRIANDGVVYTDPTKTITAGNTYTLTFDIRSINCPDWENTVAEDGYYLRMRATLNGKTSSRFEVTDEWTNISVQITPTTGGELKLRFVELTEWDFLPYDIDNITLVCNETGDTLIDHAMTINNGGGTGWAPSYSYARTDIMPKDVEVSVVTEETYYRVASSGDENNGFTYSGDDYLEKGIWHITGDFRLAEYRKDKLELGNREYASINHPYIISDNNVSYLTANVNGTVLRNIDGLTDGIAITPDWANDGFVLVVDSVGGLRKSDIEFTLSDGTAFDFKNIKYTPVDDLYIDDFVTEDGTPIAIVKEALNTETGEIGDFDSKFARIYNITYAPHGAVFKDSSVNLTAGTEYELSFWARTMPTDNWPVNSKYQGSRRLYVIQTTKLATIDLFEDWTKYTIRFTPESSTALSLTFRDGTSFDDIIPFDIDGLSLMTVDAASGEVSGENLITNDDTIGTNGWSKSGNASIEILSDNGYYRVLPPADETSNTTVAIAKDEMLVPGTYSIRGMFRLAEPLDYTKFSFDGYNVSGDSNNAKIKAYITSARMPLQTEGGLSEVTINPYTWTEVTFIFETLAEVNMNTILFEAQGNIQLDFTAIDVELIERKVTMSDVNPGFIMILLMLKDQNKYNGLSAADISIEEDWKVNGDKAVRINNMPEGVTSDSYISVSSRQSSDTGATYKNKAAMVYAGKQYQLTFKARTLPATNEGKPVTWKLRVITGDSKLISSGINLTEDWNTYSFKFSPNTDTTLAINFKGASGTEQFYPFDIDDLSVVDLSTGEELATKSGALYSNAYSAGWSALGYSSFTANLSIVSEGIYYSANLNNGIVYNPEEPVILEPGQYYLTGKFRVPSMEYEKLELDKSNPDKNGHVITADNNVAGISAYLGDTKLALSDGTDTIAVGTVWTTVKFPFELTEATDISGLKFVSDLDGDIYFDELKITTNNGDNLLSDAVSEDGLANWSASGQTLEYKVDDDGTKYFSASNLINNRVGFRYESETVIEPGVYVIKGDFRTSVEGETGYVRMIAYDAPETAKITNEWRTLELYVEVTEASNLKLHICGAPMSTSVQNYDFKNLSILNAADLVPANVELYEAGDFEDPETALVGWAIFSAQNAKLTYETEDGNSFLRMSERPNEYCGISVSLDTPAYPGTTYKISYDIRTAKEGIEMVARSYLGTDASNPLKVDGETYEGSTFMYPINNEWRHVEAEITVDSMTNFVIRISGGMDPIRDIYSFDVDNLSIVKLDK